MTWVVSLSVSYDFAFSYCSWGSQGKNTEVVCHSLLQWTTFCQTSPPWANHLGWPHTAWLSVTELDKLWSCDQIASFSVIVVSVCLPSDDLSQQLLSYLGFCYLGSGYLFTAPPAKHSCCSLSSWNYFQITWFELKDSNPTFFLEIDDAVRYNQADPC